VYGIIENQPIPHSEIYNNLSAEDKGIVDAILSFLSGRNIDSIKKLLGTVSREVDLRGFLSHQ